MPIVAGMETTDRRRVTVVGNGPAGIAAALSAAGVGAQVTLVGEAEIGGRAGWDSLVPSKVWLAAVERAAQSAAADALGVSVAGVSVEPERVLQAIREVAAGWAEHQREQLRSRGVRLMTGVARTEGHTRVLVSPSTEADVVETVDSDAVILAPGSEAVFPAGMRPDGRVILAPRVASRLGEIPARVVIVGAGATGAEFAHLFLRLGSHVTWLVDTYGVLPGMAADAVAVLVSALTRAGLELRAGVAATAVEAHGRSVTVSLADGGSVTADAAFLAVGRVPDLTRIAHQPSGSVTPTGAAVDGFGRTATPGLYLVGDAAGPPMLANDAESMAVAAGRHAAGAPSQPHRPDAIVHAVYTEPALAQVGEVGQAGDAGGALRSQRVSFRDCLKPWLSEPGPATDPPTNPSTDSAEGFLTLFCDASTGAVRGAVAVGPGAPDAVAPVAVAIAAGASVQALAAAGPAYPTLSELPTLAARRLMDSWSAAAGSDVSQSGG